MNYQTINGEFHSKYEILHSVFICNIKGVNSPMEATEFYHSICKQYSDATHNCYAYLFSNGDQKFSDDGEPSGTAGQPILQVIKKNNLVNVVAVITRYFGGIKLGTGGLVSAYTQSTVDGIMVSTIITKQQSYVGKVKLNYTEYSLLNNYIQSNNFVVIEIKFDNEVELEFALPIASKKEMEEKISQFTSGLKNVEWIKDAWIAY
jgi:uncharacterized YigZ family protein